MGDATKTVFLRSGQLAGQAGVSTDTLRHYERRGLLASQRASNGYRQFPPEALGRVRLIQHALSVGFTLDELARFLAERNQGGAPCREVRALAARKLEELDLRIRALRRLRKDLHGMLADWDGRLARTKNGGRAWLLESLADGGSHARSMSHRKGERK